MTYNNFLAEILLSLTISILALAVLRPALQTILADLRQGAHRAEFWVRFTLLMLIIGPLLGTFLLSPTQGYQEGFGIADFREILRHVLLGVFATLCSVGYVVWKSIRRRNSDTGQATDDPAPMSGGGA
jgi:MFS family permease